MIAAGHEGAGKPLDAATAFGRAAQATRFSNEREQLRMEQARTLATDLSELGCRLALDDFGSGFGSFYYLKHLPFDVVKIDGEFVKDLPGSRTDQLTVQAIVQIARGLGKPTVAEYVENAATLELLRRFGVDNAQGYHIGRPRPVAVAPSFSAEPVQ